DKYVYTFDLIKEADHFDSLFELGQQCEEKYKEQLFKIKESVKPDDLATILYTSGTTGVPKGVMLSHDNLISNVKASTLRLKLNHNHRVLSFLPLNHVYERIMNYQCQYKGISVYYAEDMTTIGDNLKEIKPHGFATVPRLLEKVYDKIITKSKSLSLPKRWIFHWAIDLGTKYEPGPNSSHWYRFQLKFANKLVFSKWREALGGNLQFIGSGGAALQERLERVFWAAGLRIQEGYGLTETSPIIATNMDYWPEVRFGTVGTLLEGVEVKIAEDGEILTKGPNVMLGYYKDPGKTREVIDEDGWFHTGDIGKMVDNKFLKITDRKKEMFKTSGGKYIAPQVIENCLKESIFIDQAMVIGEMKRFPAVIIAPNFEFLYQYCPKKNVK
ncbi:MAG: AMP-binding protein, partial [Firmicutes bacterium]|nr:AMP-binding protein [Bacillota bacterium]